MTTETARENEPRQPRQPDGTPEDEAAEITAWREAEIERRIAEEEERENPRLHALECYPDELQHVRKLGGEADVVPDGHAAIAGVIGSRCCGWSFTPEPEEVAAAMRTETPSKRERLLRTVVLSEADWEEMVEMLDAGSFSMRDVARAFRDRGCWDHEKLAWMNAWIQCGGTSANGGEP